MAGRAAKFWVSLLSTKFSSDGIQIESVEGREAISQLFEFDVKFVTTSPANITDIEGRGAPGAAVLLGAPVTLEFSFDNKPLRLVHGMINHVECFFDSTEDSETYRVKIVPELWRLTTITCQEIYLNMSVPEIIEQKLKKFELERSGTDYEIRLEKTYPKREFVVQYNESDFAFVCRLAEHLGISFFFEHGAPGVSGAWDPLAETDGVDKVVFADNEHHFKPIAGDAPLRFVRTGEEKHIYDLSCFSGIVPKVYWQRDYNYLHARDPLAVEDGDVELELGGRASLELAGAVMGAQIEYGGHFLEEKEADDLATVRSEAAQARQCVYHGKSDIVPMASGSTFEVEPAQVAPVGLLIVELHHHVTQSVLMHGGTGDEMSYRNSFRAIAKDRTYRPPRQTPVPRIAGIMTGFVRARTDHKAGNTTPNPPLAAIDDQGRYIVMLHFDTPGRDASHQGQEKGGGGSVLASAPIRMAQPSVGADYGFHMPLRAGAEVKIAFVGGDPDRPVIIGAVNNVVTPNVVTAKAGDASKSRLKSQTGILIEFTDA